MQYNVEPGQVRGKDIFVRLLGAEDATEDADSFGSSVLVGFGRDDVGRIARKVDDSGTARTVGRHRLFAGDADARSSRSVR